MIFPLEQLVKFTNNVYEITVAASHRAYQMSMITLKLAEMLSKTLHPTGIIVKDMNTMKMYTANENKTE